MNTSLIISVVSLLAVNAASLYWLRGKIEQAIQSIESKHAALSTDLNAAVTTVSKAVESVSNLVQKSRVEAAVTDICSVCKKLVARHFIKDGLVVCANCDVENFVKTIEVSNGR